MENQLSKKEIEEIILKIESSDINALSIDQIKQLLKPMLNYYKVLSPFLNQDTILYRGIVYSDKPENISYLSYPPKILAKINRASRENDPYFYCSSSRQAPFYELDLKVGDKIVLSKWRTTTQIFVNNVGYTNSNFANLKSNRENQKWFAGKKNVPVHSEENNLIQDFLAKTFSQKITESNKELYKLTIAIAEKHYSEELKDGAVNIEGLIYPTIPMKANADNIAFRPSVIDSGRLVFEEVEFIEVTKAYDSKYDINMLDWANSISETGNIEWKGRSPQYTLYEWEEYYMNIEDGKQVIRNGNGEIINPH